MHHLPRLLITMGDVAGIGPEIIARAWPDLLAHCCPAVVGDTGCMERALALVGRQATISRIRAPEQAEPASNRIPCLTATERDLTPVTPGRVSAAAGRAAYDFLCRAIDWTLAGEAEAIVTAPLHKAGLRAAGLAYPGHTEILAERTGTRRFAMMLYLGSLGVIHVTLHLALRDVFCQLTSEAILEKIELLNDVMHRLLDRPPRIGVAGLNPHASDGGLFGDEEAKIIEPAVQAARQRGLNVSGPWPADTLFVRARPAALASASEPEVRRHGGGEFDGLVAMYHDQGHIALKLLGGLRAVNVSVGLPLVRTSVAHGTAYDIAGRGIADASSLIESVRVAARLAKK